MSNLNSKTRIKKILSIIKQTKRDAYHVSEVIKYDNRTLIHFP